MAETDNLKLALPASNEYVDVEVLNENFRKIDTSVLLALAAAAPYSSEQTYALGAYCTRGGKLYRCTTAISAVEVWTDAHWTETTMGAELIAISIALAKKAPAGYGLGTTSVAGASYDANNCTRNGWYICNVNTPNGAWWYVFTAANYSNDVIVQKAWYYNGGKVIECMRLGWLDRAVDLGGGWQPWEWVNPRMLLGIEYRTTERYMDKPVYAKMVDFGALPNATSKYVDPGISNFDTLTEPMTVKIKEPDGSLHQTPFVSDTGIIVRSWFKMASGGIAIRTTDDRSSSIAYATLKYTKTTD